MDKKVIASVGITNSLSLNVYEVNEREEKVLVKFSSEEKAPRWHKIYHTANGESHIRMGSARYKLSEMMRVS